MTLRYGEEVSLRDFADRFVDGGSSKTERLKMLEGTPGPRQIITHDFKQLDAYRFVPPTSERREAPTADFAEHQALHDEIVGVLRTKLASPQFVAEGRRASGYGRIAIDSAQWATLEISLRDWTVGVGSGKLIDVRVRLGQKPSEDERLYELVHACLTELEPGTKIVRGTIQTLSETLSGFNVTDIMFRRAWERATGELPEHRKKKWTDPGRR